MRGADMKVIAVAISFLFLFSYAISAEKTILKPAATNQADKNISSQTDKISQVDLLIEENATKQQNSSGTQNKDNEEKLLPADIESYKRPVTVKKLSEKKPPTDIKKDFITSSKNLLRLSMSYVRSNIMLSSEKIKANNVSIKVGVTHFTEGGNALTLDAVKINGRRYNGKLISPLYVDSKYLFHKKYDSWLARGGIGVNYYDNGIRSYHEAVQRHIIGFIANLGGRIPVSDTKILDMSVDISPGLTHVMENPKNSNFSANASFIKLSGSFEMPTFFDRYSMFTVGMDIANYFYKYRVENRDKKHDSMFFIGAGIIKHF